MKGLYLRWAAIAAVSLVIVALCNQRYQREVTAVPVGVFAKSPSEGAVRLLGMIEAGSLTKNEPAGEAAFRLTGNGKAVSVRYAGQDLDTLRELKTLVLIGRWDPARGSFEAGEIGLVPNYGYVAAAYLIGMIPLGLFLFRMEQKVELLYTEIKEAKAYEPEAESGEPG
jgi:cytochrome c-type biogenesis protein CcmE